MTAPSDNTPGQTSATYAEGSGSVEATPEFAAPASLLLDPINPRMPLMTFSTEGEAIRYMVDSHDVDELVRSILVNGWLDFEPLIVEKGSNVVLEGNRRLAALKLLTSASLREEANYSLPDLPNAKPSPSTVRVRWVDDRKAARSYIGFKHVNGPFKWDAYAKAKFAVAWLDEEGSLAEVSRALGDTHNTVRRLVDGWRVLQQAISWGFSLQERGSKRFAFSHLYTAIARPSVRQYLGLTLELADVLSLNPVPESHRLHLMNLMGWLYGNGPDVPPVLRSQNPDLGRIAEVLSNEGATAELIRSRNLDLAYEEIVPKSTRFVDALYAAIKSAERASALNAHFNGDPVQLEAAQNLFLTVRGLRDNMRSKVEGGDE